MGRVGRVVEVLVDQHQAAAEGQHPGELSPHRPVVDPVVHGVDGPQDLSRTPCHREVLRHAGLHGDPTPGTLQESSEPAEGPHEARRVHGHHVGAPLRGQHGGRAHAGAHVQSALAGLRGGHVDDGTVHIRHPEAPDQEEPVELGHQALVVVVSVVVVGHQGCSSDHRHRRSPHRSLPRSGGCHGDRHERLCRCPRIPSR